MAEHDAKDVCSPPLAVGLTNGNARAEIDLGFVTRSTFHPPERQRLLVLQTPHKAAHAGVLTRKAMIADQVLVDALGRKAGLQLADNNVPPRLAQAWLPGSR